MNVYKINRETYNAGKKQNIRTYRVHDNGRVEEIEAKNENIRTYRVYENGRIERVADNEVVPVGYVTSVAHTDDDEAVRRSPFVVAERAKPPRRKKKSHKKSSRKSRK